MAILHFTSLLPTSTLIDTYMDMFYLMELNADNRWLRGLWQ